MPLEITPLGGVGEVGRNCFLYRDSDSGQGIMVDCGVKIIREEGKFIHQRDTVPLLDRAGDCRLEAILPTHGHQDHLAYALEASDRFRAPIFASRIARHFLHQVWEGQRNGKRGNGKKFPYHIKDLNTWRVYQFGPFQVRTFVVNHSIPEAYGLIIRTRERTVVHLGDFKFNGVWSDSRQAMDRAVTKLPKPDLLILDTLNINQPGETSFEWPVLDSVAGLIKEQLERPRGRIFITLFASNLIRLRELVRFSHRLTGRNPGFIGRSMLNSRRILSFNPARPSEDDRIIFLTGNQAEEASALWGLSTDNQEFFDRTKVPRFCRPGPDDLVVFSSRGIPDNLDAIKGLIYILETACGTRVVVNTGEREHLGLTEGLFQTKEANTHVSGHGFRGDIKRAVETIKPQMILPYHSDDRRVATKLQALCSVNSVIVSPGLGETIRI